MYIPCQTGW